MLLPFRPDQLAFVYHQAAELSSIPFMKPANILAGLSLMSIFPSFSNASATTYLRNRRDHKRGDALLLGAHSDLGCDARLG